MKYKRIVILLFIIVINLLFLNINKVQAAGMSDVISGGEGFISAGKNSNVSLDTNELKNTSDSIYNILLLLGIVIDVIIASILGIKFMIGSAEEKAQIKDALIPFVIGSIVIFGAFGFWKIVVGIANSL